MENKDLDYKAKVARIAHSIVASDTSLASDVKAFVNELLDIKKRTQELADKFKPLRKRMWDVAHEGDIDDQRQLLNELGNQNAGVLDKFEYFDLTSLMNSLKISLSEKEPVSYNGFVIKVERVSTYYLGFSIYKNGKKVYDSGKNGGWEDYDKALEYAKERIDKYLSTGDSDNVKNVIAKLGIANAYYVKKAYEYRGDANPQETRYELRSHEASLESLAKWMKKNGVTDASQIKVVEKNTNASYVFDRYDSASYEVEKGWRIVLQVGNDTWDWGVYDR